MVFLAHVSVIALALLGALMLEIPLNHLSFGFLCGVAVFSMYWRHIYGFWPEEN